MKKVLTVLALLAFTTTAFAATSITTKLNNGLNTLSQKEQALNNKIDKAQAERAARKAEAQKKQEEQKKAIEAQKKAIKQTESNAKKQAKAAKKDAKNRVEAEKSFWRNLFK